MVMNPVNFLVNLFMSISKGIPLLSVKKKRFLRIIHPDTIELYQDLRLEQLK